MSIATHPVFGYPCQSCGRATVTAVTVRDYPTTINGCRVTVPDAVIGVCPSCGEEHFAAAETKRWETFRPTSSGDAHTTSMKRQLSVQGGTGLRGSQQSLEHPDGRVLRMPRITRAFLHSHPDWLFVFGDNIERRGYGGQAAAMRDEPNAIGIPTKRSPTMTADAFFTDADYDANCAAIDAAFALVEAALHEGRTVVLPAAGLGTGRAQLRERAPRTHLYLTNRLTALAEGHS